MQIGYEEHLTKSGYNQIALEAFSETLKDGNAQTYVLPYSYDDEVIICLVHGEPVGIITFWITEWNETVFIRIAYVKPAYRRRGIHTSMYRKLKEMARKKGAKRIYSGVSVNNSAMLALAKKQGRELVAHMFLDELEDTKK